MVQQPADAKSGRMIYEGRIHWIVLLRPAVYLYVASRIADGALEGLIHGAYLGAYLHDSWLSVNYTALSRHVETITGYELSFVLAALIGAQGAFRLLHALSLLLLGKIAVTSKLVAFPRGIGGSNPTYALAEIDRIEVVSSALGRMLGYGKVKLVRSHGATHEQPCVSRPEQLRHVVQSQVSEWLRTGLRSPVTGLRGTA